MSTRALQAGEMSAEERRGLPDVRPVRDDRGQYTLVYPAPGSWTQVRPGPESSCLR